MDSASAGVAFLIRKLSYGPPHNNADSDEQQSTEDNKAPFAQRGNVARCDDRAVDAADALLADRNAIRNDRSRDMNAIADTMTTEAIQEEVNAEMVRVEEDTFNSLDQRSAIADWLCVSSCRQE